jgi:hypothetical protein
MKIGHRSAADFKSNLWFGHHSIAQLWFHIVASMPYQTYQRVMKQLQYRSQTQEPRDCSYFGNVACEEYESWVKPTNQHQLLLQVLWSKAGVQNPLIFKNKFCWNTATSICFMHCLWLPCAASGWVETTGLPSQRHLLYGPSQKNLIPTLGLGERDLQGSFCLFSFFSWKNIVAPAILDWWD